MLDLRRWTIKVAGQLVGFERSRVHINGKPYLDRWIAYVGFGTIRLHKFWRGDDDRAPHDHPWNFVTFPLAGYFERTDDGVRYVKPWRLHKRTSDFRHIVLGGNYSKNYRTGEVAYDTVWPFYTIVVTGNRIRGWGFWPLMSMSEAIQRNIAGTVFWAGKPMRRFVPWREWR